MNEALKENEMPRNFDYEHDWSKDISAIKLEGMDVVFGLLNSDRSDGWEKDSILDYNILSDTFSEDEKITFFRRILNIQDAKELDESHFKKIRDKLSLAKKFLLKQSSNIPETVLNVKIESRQDLLKLFYKASTYQKENFKSERSAYYALIKCLFLATEVMKSVGSPEALEEQNESFWNFWKGNDEIDVYKHSEKKGRRNCKINNTHVEIRGPRVKELDSMMTKASIKEGRNVERFLKDIFAMEIHVKREDLSHILERVVESFAGSEDWEGERIYEIKNKNWLNDEEVQKLNDSLRSYGREIKENKNALSQGNYTSFSINFEMMYPDLDSDGNPRYNDNNVEAKVKRMIEVKFVPMDFKQGGMEVDPLYKLPQLLISKYKVLGPGILIEDVKMMIDKTLHKNKDIIDERITKEVVYKQILKKLFIQKKDYLVLRSDVDSMPEEELDSIFPE